MSRRAVHALLGRRSPLLAVADQLALVAGNALLGILVARSTGMEEFARFALFQALLVLLGFLHVPLVNDPLVLRGAAGAGVPLRAALASSMRLFLPLSVAGALALAALGVGDAVLALLLVPAALLVCLCGSARSVLHADGNHRGACTVSMVATLVSVLAFAGLAGAGVAAMPAAILAIAVSSLAGLGMATRFPVAAPAARGVGGQASGTLLRGLAAAGLVWVSGNVSILVLAWLERLQDIAALRAVLTLLLPLNQLLVGLSAFLMPRFAQLQQAGQPLRARRLLSALSIGCALMALLFFLCLYPLAGQLLAWIYGSGYAAHADGLRLGAAVLPLCWGLITLHRTVLRGSGRLGDLLRIHLAGLLVGIPLSLWVLLSSAENAVMGSFVMLQIALLASYLLFGRTPKAV